MPVDYDEPPFIPEVIENEDHELTANEQMDALLIKMRKKGYGSLTPAELDFIKEYKNNNTKKGDEDELDK